MICCVEGEIEAPHFIDLMAECQDNLSLESNEICNELTQTVRAEILAILKSHKQVFSSKLGKTSGHP